MERVFYVFGLFVFFGAVLFGVALWLDGDPMARLLSVQVLIAGVIGGLVLVVLARIVEYLRSLDANIARIAARAARPAPARPRPAKPVRPARPKAPPPPPTAEDPDALLGGAPPRPVSDAAAETAEATEPAVDTAPTDMEAPAPSPADREAPAPSPPRFASIREPEPAAPTEIDAPKVAEDRLIAEPDLFRAERPDRFAAADAPADQQVPLFEPAPPVEEAAPAAEIDAPRVEAEAAPEPLLEERDEPAEPPAEAYDEPEPEPAGEDETGEPDSPEPAPEAPEAAEPTDSDAAAGGAKLVRVGTWRGRELRVYDDSSVSLAVDGGWRRFKSVRELHDFLITDD